MGAILLVDIEAFRFTAGNAAVIELFGYGKEELVTMQPNKLTAVPESDLRQFVGTFSANNGCSGGLKFTHKDKAPIYTEYTISKIEHDDSRILIISARDISKRKMREKELQEAKEAAEIAEIALHEVKTLTGLLPICSGCKKNRGDEGYWNRIEHYVSEHTGIDFSHGICPACRHELYPKLKSEE